MMKHFLYSLLISCILMLSSFNMHATLYCDTNQSTTQNISSLTVNGTTYSSGTSTTCKDSSGNTIEEQKTYFLTALSGSSITINLYTVTTQSTFTGEFTATINQNITSTTGTMVGFGKLSDSNNDVSIEFTIPTMQGTPSNGVLEFIPTSTSALINIGTTQYSGSFDLTESEPSSDLLKNGETVGHVKIINITSTTTPPTFKAYKYENGTLIAL